MTRTRERVLAVDALAVLARVRQAIVDVVFAVEPGETGRTLALVTGYGVVAYAAVAARRAHAIVDVGLAPGSGEPCGTRALVPVDHVGAHAAVLARVRLALVHVDFALSAGKSWKRPGGKKNLGLKPREYFVFITILSWEYG